MSFNHASVVPPFLCCEQYSIVWMGPRSSLGRVGKERTPFPSPSLVQVAEALETELMKDRWTAKQGLLHMHKREKSKPFKRLSDQEARLPFQEKAHKIVQKW